MTQRIKYDQNKNIIVISEYMNQDDIQNYLVQNQIHYFDFNTAIAKLHEQGIFYEEK